jgi:L-cysteine desulfidase
LSLDKFITANAYRIVVVLENSMDYISEKLFDAFASNAIVIYVGPRISRYGIPDAAAIQISPNSNKINKEITELQALPVEKQFEIMQEQQKSILSISKKWYCNDVLKKLAADICEELVE